MITIEEWYSRLDVKYEMIRYLYNREFAVLSKEDPSKSTRHLKAHNVNFLEKNFDMLKFFDKQYNCFYSLDKFKNGVPMFSFDLANRNTQDWVMNRYKEVVAHDMLLDFDAASFEDVQETKKEVLIVKKLMDNNEVPYSLRYSGMGFHTVIPYDYTGASGSFNPGEPNNIYTQMVNMLNYIQKILNLQRLDVKCTAFGRIMKIPYSMALYPDDESKICLPLNDQMMANFDVSMADPEWVSKNIRIQRRGDLMRQGTKTFKDMIIKELDYAENK